MTKEANELCSYYLSTYASAFYIQRTSYILLYPVPHARQVRETLSSILVDDLVFIS